MFMLHREIPVTSVEVLHRRESRFIAGTIRNEAYGSRKPDVFRMQHGRGALYVRAWRAADQDSQRVMR